MIDIDAMLKLSLEEQERAAKHALRMLEVRATPQEPDVKRSSRLAQSRLAQNLGMLLPWRTRTRLK